MNFSKQTHKLNIDIKLLKAVHAQVYYAPTLGVVLPLAFEKSIRDVLAVADTTNFLPYDKDKRWHDKKKEMVLNEFLFQNDMQTIITTLSLVNKPIC